MERVESEQLDSSSSKRRHESTFTPLLVVVFDFWPAITGKSDLLRSPSVKRWRRQIVINFCRFENGITYLFEGKFRIGFKEKIIEQIEWNAKYWRHCDCPAKHLAIPGKGLPGIGRWLVLDYWKQENRLFGKGINQIGGKASKQERTYNKNCWRNIQP